MEREEYIGRVKTLLEAGEYSKVVSMLEELHPADIAEVLEEFGYDVRQELLQHLTDDVAAEVLQEMDAEDQSELLQLLPEERASGILEEMASDDLVDLLSEVSQEDAVEILSLLQGQEAEDVKELMVYSEDSAGGIMTTDYVALGVNMTTQKAIETLRVLSPDAEMIYYVYVINETNQLVGVLSLRELIVSQPHTVIKDIMRTNIISVLVDTDQEEVAKVVAKYDLLAVPVVDEESTILGIITVDDIIDVMEEEASEDYYRMAGAPKEEIGLVDEPLSRAKARFPWLLVLLIGELFAAKVIEGYTGTLETFVALAYFIPVLIGMGGNVGTQSLAVTVRGLATEEYQSRDIWRVVWTESRVGILLGLASGITIFIISYFWFGDYLVGTVVALSMVVALIFAAILGTVVPFTLDKLKIDPAIASGPFVTTTLDIVGILIYFSIATLVIFRFF